MRKIVLALAMLFALLTGGYSPVLAQQVICPTAAAGTRDNRCASTAFVQNNAPWVSIITYGGKGDNSKDNVTPLNNALAENPCATIYFPPGKYKFTTAVSKVMPASGCSLTLQGAGQGQGGTVLNWANDTDGLSFTWASQENSIHVRDMTISTDSTSGTRFGLAIQNSNTYGGFVEATQNDISRVTFQGNGGNDATKYWGVSVYAQAVSYVVFDTDLFYGGVPSSPAGIGISLADAVDNLLNPIVTANFNIVNTSFLNHDTAILLTNNPQGVIVTSSTFADNTAGIAYSTNSTRTLEGINIVNSNFADRLVDIFGGCGVGDAGLADLNVTGGLFIANNGAGTVNNNYRIELPCVYRFSVAGAVFNGASEATKSPTAIYVNKTSGWPGTIVGNTFAAGPSLSGNAFVYGIFLDTNAQQVAAWPNTFMPYDVGPGVSGVQHPVTDNGTNNSTFTLPCNSGSIPYLANTYKIGCSNTLTSFGPVVGGGAGGAPVAITPGTDGQVMTGQTGASPAFKTMSGDCTYAAAGAITCLGTNGVPFTSVATATVGQLPGTTTNDSAAAGKVGEFASARTTNATQTFTVTIASPAVFTGAPANVSNGSAIELTTTGSLPTGLSTATPYYITNLSGSGGSATYQVSTTPFGTSVNTSGTQSGTHTATGALILTSGVTVSPACIQLTAGDWDVWGISEYVGGTTTTVSLTYQNVATQGASTDNSANGVQQFSQLGSTPFNIASFITGGHSQARKSLSSTTVECINAAAVFGTSTMSTYGGIFARRAR